MSKVVRISDEAFSRLQQLAEPLVDTPSSVIDKLLDKYESSLTQNKSNEPMNKHVSNSTESLFLVPADKSNIKLSIQKRVKVKDAIRFLSSKEKKKLETILVHDESFNCWAMTESNQSTFKSMKEGDRVLLSEKGTGKFNYTGIVKGKIESKSLGNNLWSFTPGKPWSLIYVLDNIKPVNIDKQKMVKILGYKENYWVPGVIRVQEENLKLALTNYGNINSMLNLLDKL